MFGINTRALGVTWTVFLFCLVLALVWWIRSTLMVFAAAVFFAYMISPVVDVVERTFKRRRGLALAVVYCLLIGTLVFLGLNLVPTVTDQAISLAKRLPGLISGGNLAKLPLPSPLEPMREEVIPMLSKAATNLETRIVPFLQEAGTRLLSGLGELLPIILIPIFAFFFLKDARSMRGALLANLSRRHRPTVDKILSDIHNVLRNYIRALVLLSIASFVAWAVFLSIMRYPYELLLAGISAILEFIPVVGPAAALVIMVTVFLVTGSGGILWVVIFWMGFRVFQDYVLSPYLMSSGIELHPLLVLFGVLAGEALAGIPGMFFSVPVLAILRVVVNRMQERERAETTPEVRTVYRSV